MEILTTVKDWLWKIALKKAVQNALKTAAGALAVWLAAHEADLNRYGVDINLETATLISAAVGALEMLRNWAKIKLKIKWL